MSPQASAKLLGPGPPPCVVAKPWAGTGSSDSYTAGLCLSPSSSHLLAGLGGAVSPAARGSPRSELRPQSCQNGHLLPAALPLRALDLPAPHRPADNPHSSPLPAGVSWSPAPPSLPGWGHGRGAPPSQLGPLQPVGAQLGLAWRGRLSPCSWRGGVTSRCPGEKAPHPGTRSSVRREMLPVMWEQHPEIS